MTKNKIIFFTIWILILSLGPIAVMQNTSITLMMANRVILVNVILRISGLVGFTLLFSQIVVGFFMFRLVEKLGGWIFKFHVIEGIFAYFLVLMHPILFGLSNYFSGKGIDPFYIFTDICVLCSNKFEVFNTLGRVSFWLVTIAVIAGIFKTATPWLRVNWRKLHIFNYVAFLLIGLHSIFLGTDIGTFPYSFFFGPAMFIVLGLGGYKLFHLIKPLIQKRT